ncbi:cation:proton antiporter [Aestuariibacter sp. AA17]|uniref:Cation:proton antiporter n=1 Tax=Fluctibacter corallii TaxID=2984329 RepID=A0ABT3A872_9ALTE|nr:cation:proton antiporter family protein [Aestuariibacter sp. AA17]MCV2884482.1 cation:proton antiporter [Aestuariibacter sp. AA17]
MDYSAFTDMLRANAFYELTTLLGITALFAFVGQLLRQPVIVSFIAVGVVVGPSVLDIVHSDDSIALLSQLGIAILLFLVGLKLDLSLIRSLGKVAVATGLGQVIFTSVIGLGICLLLDFDFLTSVYVGVALTFSSTIIIVKMLSDKREVDALHGRIAIGFLIVQDIVVVIAMVVLSAMGIGESAEQGLWQRLGEILLSAMLMLVVTLLFVRFWANNLIRRVARSSEQLLIFAVALAAIFASIGHVLGFSKELGGLLAGVALASTPYREAIITRLASLRDFLLLFFFISLGSQLDLSILGEQMLPAVILSLFVLIGNPLIVMIIMGLMGYRSRTGFLAGLTVAQISEFSLIFIAMGISIGHLQNEALGLVTLVGLVTIALSVYMISHSHRLYERLSPWFKIFELSSRNREIEQPSLQKGHTAEILVCGAGHYGTQVLEHLIAQNRHVGVIDFNPEIYHHWLAQDIPSFFGDISDVEFLSHLPLRDAKWFIATLPRDALGSRFEDPRRQMIENLRNYGFTGRIAIAINNEKDAEKLRELGVDVILTPYRDAAVQAARIIH